MEPTGRKEHRLERAFDVWENTDLYVCHHGKGAGAARELLLLMADRWEKTAWSAEIDDMGRLEPAMYRETWPPDVVAKMTGLWEKARGDLKDDPEALRKFLYVTWGFETFPEEVKAQSAAKPKGR